MALVAYDDFFGYWVVTGAGSPIPDKVTGGRDLTLSGGATVPRQASYSRRRGAEFKTTTFTATAPAVYSSATASGLNTSLYVSSKIKTFTWAQKFRPQRTGSTEVVLTPLGGLFSTTNAAGTPSLWNQPCMLAIPALAGSSKLLVFVGDKIFDTTYATQSEGPTSTTPISDEGWNAVAVCVTGSTTTNNQIDSVVVYTENPDGVRRKYTLGARKAGARLNFTGQPSDGDTVTIGANAFTFKTALGGVAATSTIIGTGVQPADGETITINGVVYTFKTSLTAVLATAVIEVNVANPFKNEASKGEAAIRVGGYQFYLRWGTEHVRGEDSGTMDGVGSDTGNQGQYLVDYLNGVYDDNESRFVKPATPARTGTGEYTDDNNEAWGSPNREINWIATGPVTAGNIREITIQAQDDGATQVPVVVIDGWQYGLDGTQTGKPTNWRVRVKSGTVDNPVPFDTYDDGNGKTQGVTKGGVSAPPLYSVLIGSTYADTVINLKHAILKTGATGTNWYGVAAANSVVASINIVGNDLVMTSSLAGEAGNAKVVTDTSLQFTTANFLGGTNGSTDPRYILIAGTSALTWANIVACLNGTGTPGIDYGNSTSSADTSVSATLGSSYFLLLADSAGAAGNAIAVSKSCAAISGIKDEFNDTTVTTLVGGCDAGAWVVGAGARPDNTDLKVFLGGLDSSPTGTKGIFYGTVSDAALSNKVWTTQEFADWTTTPPPTSTRDRGWYRAATRMSYQARTETMTDWRLRTAMPTGNLSPRIPITLNGSRCSFRFWGVEAGRPYSVSQLAVDQFKRGGVQGPRRYVYTFPGFEGGVDKSTSRDGINPATLSDLLNMGFHHRKARRRRGFRVLTSDATGTESYPMAFFDATTASGEVYHLVYRNGTLYAYDNEVLTSVDTGWPPNEIPTFATVGEKTYIATSSKTRIFKGGSVFEPGVAAPTDAPALLGLTADSTAVVVTKPGWDYVVTYYDGTHETDSGPSPALKILRLDETAISKVNMSIPVSTVSTITKRKIWKRRRNTDTFFLVAIVDNNTDTSYEDTVDQPSSVTLESFSGVDVTADWPDITQVAEHEGRVVGWGGADKRILLYSEVGDGERWFPLNALRAKADILASVSHEGRHFIYTNRTVEVVDGDFIRGSSGALAVGHKVLDTSKGTFGPYAVAVGRGHMFWADPVGVHVMGRGVDQKDVTETISWMVHPYVQNAIDTAGTTVVMDFNHISQDLWICLTQSNPDSDTKNRVTLVFNLETRRWTVYDHPLSWVCRVNDGVFGQQFYGCDYYGNLLELDVYDGDGCEGNESWHPAAGRAITSISGNTINFTGTALPTTLRGCSVVLEDLSSLSTPFYRATILSSTTTSITVDSMPTAIIATDLAHIGGIIGMIETAETDLGTPESKTWHYASVGLSDLTRADY